MTSYYVDPSINANSGAGTVGDPYGDLQYALDTITRNATTGDRINIKAGTAEVLTATLDVSTYGTPIFGAGLAFVGYTTAEGDGGIGEIDGDATYSIWNLTSVEGITFCDLTVGNCGSGVVLAFDRFCSVKNCKVHTTTGNGITGQAGLQRAWLDNIGGVGIGSSTYAYDCLFTNGTNKFSAASTSGALARCCFKLDSTSHAVDLSTSRIATLNHCSFYTTGTGQAIKLRPIYAYIIEACLIEGFSTGIDYSTTTDKTTSAHNYCAFYDNTTDADSAEFSDLAVGNEFLGANLFDLSGSITSFADRLTYFNPVDQGNVYTGMPGGLVKGAVQPASSGGGSGYPRSRILNG